MPGKGIWKPERHSCNAKEIALAILSTGESSIRVHLRLAPSRRPGINSSDAAGAGLTTAQDPSVLIYIGGHEGGRFFEKQTILM